MKIGRVFWVRTKGSIQQAFSYNKDSQAEKFADKYGGVTVPSIEVDDNASSIVGNGTVFSYLVNASPQQEISSSDASDFLVFVKTNGSWTKHQGFATISEANTEAKNIIKNFEEVLVVKQG